MQEVFAHARNNLQDVFACAIKPGHAGNFLHIQGIICMHMHAYDGKPY